MAIKKYICPPTPASGAGSFSDDLVGFQLVQGGGLTQGNFNFVTTANEKSNRNFITGTFSEPINLSTLGLSSISESDQFPPRKSVSGLVTGTGAVLALPRRSTMKRKSTVSSFYSRRTVSSDISSAAAESLLKISKKVSKLSRLSFDFASDIDLYKFVYLYLDLYLYVYVDVYVYFFVYIYFTYTVYFYFCFYVDL